MNGILFCVLATLIILVGPATMLLNKKSNSSETFDSLPRHFGALVLSLSTLGTIVGGGMFLAVGAMGFEAGILGFVFGLVYIVGLTMFGLSSSRIIQVLDRLHAGTLSEAILSAFGSRAGIIFSTINLLIFVPLIGAQFIALYTGYMYFSSQFAMSWEISVPVVVALIVLIVYPAIGGLRLDIVSDLVQSVVLLIAASIIIFSIILPTDWLPVFQSLPQSHLDGTGYGIVTLIGVMVFLTPSFFVRSDMWQRVRTATSPSVSWISFLFAGILSLMFYTIFTLLGILAFSMGTSSADNASLDMISSLISNQLLASFILASLFAAILSSADTFINNSATHLRTFVISAVGASSEKVDIRWCALIVTLGAALLAYLVGNIVDLFVNSLSLLMIFLAPVLAMLFSESVSPRAFVVSTTLSVALFFILFLVWDPKSAFAPAVVVSLICYFIVRKLETLKSS